MNIPSQKASTQFLRHYSDVENKWFLFTVQTCTASQLLGLGTELTKPQNIKT